MTYATLKDLRRGKPPTHIVLHHNGAPGRTVADIDRTHKAKGWSGIGYHFAVYDDLNATVHMGRPLLRPNGAFNLGAHTNGFNRTIGIVLIGNGDKRDFTVDQYASLRKLCVELMAGWNIASGRVIGHRETRWLVPPELATKKQCPGLRFDLERFRATLDTPLALV